MFRTLKNLLRRSASEGEAVTSHEEVAAYRRQEVLYVAGKFGYAPDSEAVLRVLSVGTEALAEMDYTELVALFNPCGGRHVEALVGEDSARGIYVKAMASNDSAETIGRIVDAWVGDLGHIVATVVSSHETSFYDANGDEKVRFYGAGRKMHHGDGFRVHNAIHALGLLGIDVAFEDIALRDMAHFYAPLKFERSMDGSWTHHEEGAVRA